MYKPYDICIPSMLPLKQSPYKSHAKRRNFISLRLAAVLCLCVLLPLNVFYHFWFLQMVEDHTVKHNVNRCEAAFVFFGLPKSFPVVWKAYQQNLILNNPHIHFDISMHLYSDITSLTNPKNGEVNVPMESASTLLHTIGQGEDVIVQTSQAAFDETNLSWLKGEHLVHFGPGWSLNTLKNMFRQGNSMEQSYQHALRKGNNKKYQVFVFARPDTFLADKIDIDCNMADTELRLPSWQVHVDDEINDRFAIAGPSAARIYVQAKAEGFIDYVKRGDEGDFKEKANFWNSVKIWISWIKSSVLPSNDYDYSGKGSWNSEHLLWRWLNENTVDVKKGSRQWAPLLRIRGGNTVNWRDARTFPRGWLKFRMTTLKKPLRRRP